MKAVLLADSPGALVELCGVSMIERMLRVLQRLGFSSVSIVDANDEIRAALARPSWPRANLQLEFADEFSAPDEVQLLIPGDVYCDTRLLVALMQRKNSDDLIDSNPPNEWLPLLAGAQRSDAGFICGPKISGDESDLLDVATFDRYDDLLRRKLHPLWFPAPAPPNVALAEHFILDSTQKGILDLTARLHWPFENFLVRQLWRTKVTPNQVTFFATLLGCFVTIELARGRWWTGILLARVFAILDGVDGKLARVKVETTELGRWENYVDSVLEYSWWLALAYSLGAVGLAHAWVYAALIIAGDWLGKLANRIVATHTGGPSHRASEFERWFRLVGGRRDIYTAMLLIGLLVRQPGLAFAAAGAWSVISAAGQGLRAAYIRFLTPRCDR